MPFLYHVRGITRRFCVSDFFRDVCLLRECGKNEAGLVHVSFFHALGWYPVLMWILKSASETTKVPGQEKVHTLNDNVGRQIWVYDEKAGNKELRQRGKYRRGDESKTDNEITSPPCFLPSSPLDQPLERLFVLILHLTFGSGVKIIQSKRRDRSLWKTESTRSTRGTN